MDEQSYNMQVHHPLQSWQWGEARKETGLNVVRIDGFTMTIHPVPHTPFKIGYIPRSANPSSDLIDKLVTYGKENNLIFIKFEPDELHSSDVINLLTSHLNLRKSPHPLFPQWTQVLDLTLSNDDLMKQLKPKTRYNMRYAQKNNVIVKEMSTDEGFKLFSDLYFETCKRQHYHGHTPEYHRIVWENLKDGIAHILIAFYNDEPLAAYELFYFDHKWYYPYGGSSEKHRKLMASNLLMWEAIQLGKSLGAYEFDMWGSLPPNYDEHDSWSGFTRFKEGYGTKFKQFVGSYDLVIKPFHYSLYNKVYKLREMMLGH
ncbi:MAG: peptidoglycan bridge formation glycyltransferase FemA/FemB family protein [bacterium]|nr:peptidoglycan bridge formation glycyltransferase FemA/FemB family protein [bacterium]